MSELFKRQVRNSTDDVESIAKRLRLLPQSEADTWEERREILRDGLNSFNARLVAVAGKEHDSALSLLYKEMIDLVFDFHLSIVMNEARREIAAGRSREEKHATLEKFKAQIEELAPLYAIR